MKLCRFEKNLIFGIFVLILITPLTTAVNNESINIPMYDEVMLEKSADIVNDGLLVSSWSTICCYDDSHTGRSQYSMIGNSGDGGWIKTFGGPNGEDVGYSVQQTTDGGYIITGITRSYGAGKGDVWLIKTYADSSEQWNKTYGGSENDEGYSVQQTTDGGYIITGGTDSYGNGYDMWLIKTDADGNEEWNKTYGGTDLDVGLSVQQTTDGGYIITGFTCSYGAGDSDVWLVKTDSSGNEQWNTTIGTIEDDEGRSVNQTDDGGYIIVGDTYPYDVWLIKMDADGNEEWNKTFGGTDHDYGHSVQQTTDGGYAFAGTTYSYSITGYSDFWLVKTDESGNEVWNKTYGREKEELGFSMQQTTDGGYIITGKTWSKGAGERDVWLIKTDSNGYKLWDKTFGGPDREEGYSVQQTTDEGYIVTGWTASYAGGNYDVLLIKAAAFENQRPSTPIITGPTKGKKGEETEHTFVSTDPDGEDLYYYIDWGEHEYKQWIGPNSSGVPIKVSHWWRYKGTWTIRAKVEDIHGGESEWATFEIEIEGRKGREVQQMLFYRLLEQFPILQKLLVYLEKS